LPATIRSAPEIIALGFEAMWSAPRRP
jgi:hypothetical protein